MAKDLFSKQAAGYSRWRPTYPPELVAYVAQLVPERRLAWDCATGNGQAALLLTDHFDKIMATDLSAEQLKHAKPHPKITYGQGTAEQTEFGDNSFDLVTVAQAYHWFDHAAFSKEAHRVCKPGALVAIWAYGMSVADDAVINKMVLDFYVNVTDPYWDAARKYVDEGYRTIPFYFEELPVERKFSIRVDWGIAELQGYLNSWSAIQKFIQVNGYNPVDQLIQELHPHWKKDTIGFNFPLYLRIGKV
ncbi:MAG TPA: class I SAM-dependent methyltransferase [Chitinophagaceae bacterium]|nr:class I SAM-dependent methyltransferase [Chitinophagaceae bacterium]